jgi:hypothetical protein
VVTAAAGGPVNLHAEIDSMWALAGVVVNRLPIFVALPA